ncbi:hypothetical protein ACFXHK_37395, partial [Embleya sp. NPDC059267]|uniref:hypothetical protein n=1 Tax=Embleya sp. NPDC059267 TaxID=3346798 RepID=UPI00367704FA
MVGRHGAAFLRGAAPADALAAIGSEWTNGSPAPLVPLTESPTPRAPPTPAQDHSADIIPADDVEALAT